VHRLVALAEPLTRIRALGANLGAHLAGTAMVSRNAQHEIRARGADLRAIEQEPDMLGTHVPAAHIEAVRQSLSADVMTLLTVPDALPHR
jgi:hypothetical protein